MGVIARMARRAPAAGSGPSWVGRRWLVVPPPSTRRLQRDLRRLAVLRDQHLLTEEEFLLAKGKLIDA